MWSFPSIYRDFPVKYASPQRFDEFKLYRIPSAIPSALIPDTWQVPEVDNLKDIIGVPLVQRDPGQGLISISTTDDRLKEFLSFALSTTDQIDLLWDLLTPTAGCVGIILFHPVTIAAQQTTNTRSTENAHDLRADRSGEEIHLRSAMCKIDFPSHAYHPDSVKAIAFSALTRATCVTSTL